MIQWSFPLHFFRLFEDHAELISLFEKFRELKTKEQQARSEELAEHANKVMETLDEGENVGTLKSPTTTKTSFGLLFTVDEILWTLLSSRFTSISTGAYTQLI